MGECTDIQAISTKDIAEDMLISFVDLSDLQRVPVGFPNTVIINRINGAESNFLSEFADVMSDDMSPTSMRCEPMTISFYKNVRPVKIMTASRVPLRFEEEANKLVKEMMKNKVITPVSETTEWCSPAFSCPRQTTRGFVLLQIIKN